MRLRDFFKGEPVIIEDARLRTELVLTRAIAVAGCRSFNKIRDFIPEEKAIKICWEYFCFFLHVTNRLAENSASYQKVNQIYQTIALAAIEYMFPESLSEQNRQEYRKALHELYETREIQYAESTEYASKGFRPLSGTSTVDMLVRNIREILDTYNPEVLFQIGSRIISRHIKERSGLNSVFLFGRFSSQSGSAS